MHNVKEVSFYDDAASVVVRPASSILNDFSSVATVILDTYAQFYLHVNMSKNKTEAIVAFYGKEAHTVRRSLAMCDNILPIQTKKGTVDLRIVQTYKHLGTTTNAFSNNVAEEVAIRSSIMCQQNNKLSKLLKQSDLPIKEKSHVCQAYIVSKGAHHCGTWPSLSSHQLKVFGKGIFAMYRAITGESYGSKETQLMESSEIIKEYGFMLPQNIIMRMRLALFARLVHKQVTILLDLVYATQGHKKSWSKSVLRDLALVSMLELHPLLSQGKDFCTLQEWASHIAKYRNFRKVIAKVCAHGLLNISEEANECALGPPLSGPCLRPLACEHCFRVFFSPQALAAHRSRVHGAKSIWRRYVRSEVHCLVCLRLFWTRERVINHIRYRSEVCRHEYAVDPPPLSCAEADELDLAESAANRDLSHRGSRRHKAVKPCIQMFGPLLPLRVGPAVNSRHHPLGRGQQYYRT